jgi:hypothetical protein
MSTWIWLNIVFGALFVLAVVGIPLWMVIARPDTGPRHASAPSRRASSSTGRSPHPAGLAAAAGAGQLSRRWPAGVS